MHCAKGHKMFGRFHLSLLSCLLCWCFVRISFGQDAATTESTDPVAPDFGGQPLDQQVLTELQQRQLPNQPNITRPNNSSASVNGTMNNGTGTVALTNQTTPGLSVNTTTSNVSITATTPRTTNGTNVNGSTNASSNGTSVNGSMNASAIGGILSTLGLAGNNNGTSVNGTAAAGNTTNMAPPGGSNSTANNSTIPNNTGPISVNGTGTGPAQNMPNATIPGTGTISVNASQPGPNQPPNTGQAGNVPNIGQGGAVTPGPQPGNTNQQGGNNQPGGNLPGNNNQPGTGNQGGSLNQPGNPPTGNQPNQPNNINQPNNNQPGNNQPGMANQPNNNQNPPGNNNNQASNQPTNTNNPPGNFNQPNTNQQGFNQGNNNQPGNNNPNNLNPPGNNNLPNNQNSGFNTLPGNNNQGNINQPGNSNPPTGNNNQPNTNQPGNINQPSNNNQPGNLNQPNNNQQGFNPPGNNNLPNNQNAGFINVNNSQPTGNNQGNINQPGNSNQPGGNIGQQPGNININQGATAAITQPPLVNVNGSFTSPPGTGFNPAPNPPVAATPTTAVITSIPNPPVPNAQTTPSVNPTLIPGSITTAQIVPADPTTRPSIKLEVLINYPGPGGPFGQTTVSPPVAQTNPIPTAIIAPVPTARPAPINPAPLPAITQAPPPVATMIPVTRPPGLLQPGIPTIGSALAVSAPNGTHVVCFSLPDELLSQLLPILEMIGISAPNISGPTQPPAPVTQPPAPVVTPIPYNPLSQPTVPTAAPQITPATQAPATPAPVVVTQAVTPPPVLVTQAPPTQPPVPITQAPPQGTPATPPYATLGPFGFGSYGGFQPSLDRQTTAPPQPPAPTPAPQPAVNPMNPFPVQPQLLGPTVGLIPYYTFPTAAPPVPTAPTIRPAPQVTPAPPAATTTVNNYSPVIFYSYNPYGVGIRPAVQNAVAVPTSQQPSYYAPSAASAPGLAAPSQSGYGGPPQPSTYSISFPVVGLSPSGYNVGTAQAIASAPLLINKEGSSDKPSPLLPRQTIPELKTAKQELCRDGLIPDAITITQDGVMHVFSGPRSFRVFQGQVAAGTIQEAWSGISDDVKRVTAVTTRQDGTSFLFVGDKYWKFDNNYRLAPDSPKTMAVGFPGVPEIDTVFQGLPSSGDMNFVKGSNYYAYNHKRFPPFKGPLALQSIGIEVPTTRKIDAAYTDPQTNNLMVVSGPLLYRFAIGTTPMQYQKLDGTPQTFRGVLPC